jgi:viroplasmin and RNaseH domain-containing protein
VSLNKEYRARAIGGPARYSLRSWRAAGAQLSRAEASASEAEASALWNDSSEFWKLFFSIHVKKHEKRIDSILYLVRHRASGSQTRISKISDSTKQTHQQQKPLL